MWGEKESRNVHQKEGRRQYENSLLRSGLPIPGKSPPDDVERFRHLLTMYNNGAMRGRDSQGKCCPGPMQNYEQRRQNEENQKRGRSAQGKFEGNLWRHGNTNVMNPNDNNNTHDDRGSRRSSSRSSRGNKSGGQGGGNNQGNSNNNSGGNRAQTGTELDDSM